MNQPQILNHKIAVFGWGTLFIWWGVSIMLDPITIGMSSIGTGLILFGVNAVRWLKGIRTNPANAVVGASALRWGTLDQVLALRFGASFALLLIIIGVIAIVSLPLRARTAQ